MKTSDALDTRLLGIYLELEIFGYSERLAQFILQQESVLFGMTARVLLEPK
jgi:hypothetical protein